MNIILCVDKNNGMLFGGKRLSQDCVLRNKILEIVGNSKLWVNSYTAKQFENQDSLTISDSFLSEAQSGEFCFVENEDIDIEKAEKVYIFNWNRVYPADTFFETDLKASGFKKIGKDELQGNSHKKITLEIFSR
jgi:hypothetical protein